MSNFLGVARRKVAVKINNNCSYTGRRGTIVAVDLGGVTHNGITDDTLTKVKLNGTNRETLLRVMCFANKEEVKEKLNPVVK